MSKLKTIQLIHLSFCVAIFAFAFSSFLANQTTIHFSTKNLAADPLLIVAPIGGLIAIFASNYVFNIMLAETKADLSLSASSKFIRYQTAFLVKMAILEGMAFFNIVVFLITSNAFTLIFAAACLIALGISRPTKDHIYTTLQLQDTDTLDGI